jgi:hypothetical protein
MDTHTGAERTSVFAANFVGNQISLGVILTANVEINLEKCYFQSSTTGAGTNLRSSKTPVTSPVIFVTDCYFADGIPPSKETLWTGSANDIAWVSSLPIPHFAADACPIGAAVPPPTPTIAATSTVAGTRTPRADCSQTWGLVARSIQSVACLEISGSVFHGLTSGGTSNGGAIATDSYSAKTTIVVECVFSSCRLTYAYACGGACDILSPELHFSRCCGVDCSCRADGQFLRANKGGTFHDSYVTLCTFLTCGSTTESGRGGLYYGDALRDWLAYLNFTSCSVAPTNLGSAVYFGATGPRVVSYITVSKCTGDSAIEDGRGTSENADNSATVEYGNFYNNQLDSGEEGGLIRLYQAPMALTACLFVGNTPAGQELWYSYISSGRYTVTNCVFSGAIPDSPNIFNPGSGNVPNSVTASHRLPQFATSACSNAADVPIPTLTPLRTPDASAAATETVSQSPPDTPSRSDIPSPSDTPRPTSTPHYPDCEQTSDLSARYVQTPSCVEVIRCVFQDLSDSGLTYDAVLYGAAICATGSLDFTAAIECTFSTCVAYSGSGGAIASESTRTVVDRCCARACASYSAGQFVRVQPHADDVAADATVSFSTLVECAPASVLEVIWPRRGAIDFFALKNEWVQYTNFTSCFLSPLIGGTGTAVHLELCGVAVLSYLTVAQCSGNVAIDQYGGTSGSTIKYANLDRKSVV